MICGECQWAEWKKLEAEDWEEADSLEGSCQPVPHLPAADITSDRPACAFFQAHYEREPVVEEPEQDEELWKKAGEMRASRR